MIPIMPRQSSDDDRPMGLKFTRNNFFSFSKSEVKRTPSQQRHQQQTPPPQQPLPPQPQQQQPQYQQPQYQQPQYQQTKKYEDTYRHSDASSYTQLSPVSSPTIPTRSPFRIRDSQASTQSNTMNHHHHNNSRNNNNSVSSHAIIKEDSTYSISSDSSSVSTDDDLSQELESIWKLKGTNGRLSQDTQKKPSSPLTSDDMLMQLLVSHALVDSKEFKVLSFEEFEELKQNYARLKNQVQVSSSKLKLDKKIQETSHTLTQLSTPTNNYRESVLILRDEALEADKKVASLSEKLNQLKEEEAQSQYKILQHTAGVLALGLHKLEEQQQKHKKDALHYQSILSKEQHSPIEPTITVVVDQQQVDNLKAELEQMTNALTSLLKRHDLQQQIEVTSDSIDMVIQSIETRLDAYKSETHQLERQVEAAEERIRLESMAEKKLEIQLKAIQEKRDAAEQKINDLQSELEKLRLEAEANQNKNNKKFDFNLESLEADMNNLNFEDDQTIALQNKVGDLEEELTITRNHLHRVQSELKNGQEELGTLKIMISDLQVASSKAQSTATVYQNREKALKTEMEQYRNEVFALRSEKEKWEKTMKRQTFMQLMDNGSESLTAKYEQQMEEQEQEYKAQLKEQAAFLDKTSRQCEHLEQEHEKLTATCKDLEELIRDKTRALDARDVQITRLEQEIKQQKQELQSLQQQRALPPKPAVVDDATAKSMKELQETFSLKEQGWIDQSAAMEANFEGIMREFDRLTGTAMEFETDKRNYERRIEELTGQVKILETQLNEEKVKNLGYQGDTPTTASLRREFRKMISDLKADHERVLEREANEKKKLEKQLKDLKHEKEMSRYERVNVGVQTLFIA